MKTIVLSLLLLFFCRFLHADSFGYRGVVTFQVESENLIVVHHHDWSSNSGSTLHKMIRTHQDPFRSDNNYAYVLCINKKTGDTIFRSPSPALTALRISEDERYIVGISKIMLLNPYQMILLSREGELLLKRHIASQEAKLSDEEYRAFRQGFARQFYSLTSRGRIHRTDSGYFIDFCSMNMPVMLGDRAWHWLYDHIAHNHLSANFGETTTNFVFWYDEADPSIAFEYEGDRLSAVTLLDPKGERFRLTVPRQRK